jgi:hypothetical protein
MPTPSPLPNRCAPDGTLHAVAARGTLMGNRGRLHRPDRTLGRARWRGTAWICCLTAFRGRRREVMGDGYTELFFLDEATALAAGHRPCFECRRAEALAFAAAWARGHALSPPPRAAEIDAALHAQRTAPPEVRAVGPLPPGTVFGHGEAFFLRLPGGAAQWDFAGYRPAPPIAGDTTVTPWTPAGSRAALAAGFRPALHPSAARYLSAR